MSYSWQDYNEPVGTTMSDWDRYDSSSSAPVGRNEAARQDAQDFLSDFARRIMTGSSTYSNAAAASKRKKDSSPYGAKQIFDNFAVYTPAPLGAYYGGESKSSGGSGGLFGSIGGLAGTLGTAAGVFGPLGAPIGAGVGALIDRFA